MGKTPTWLSMSARTASGKPPLRATKLPWRYMKQAGGALNIGFAAVAKLLLAIDWRPPLTLPSVSSSELMVSAAWTTVGSLKGISCWTHWLYTSGPFWMSMRFSIQSVAGHPVAAPDSMPKHQGAVPLALTVSVRVCSSSSVVGAA